MAQDGALDPEVVRHHVPRTIADEVRLLRRDHAGEVGVVGARLVAGGGVQVLDRRGAERARHGAAVADVTRQSARVDTGDAGHVVRSEELAEVALAAPAARAPGEIADDQAAAVRLARLVVDAGHAVVADVRVGERDDLAGVGRVGEDLLVTAQRGVEHDLAGGDPGLGLGADQLAFEELAVAEYQMALTVIVVPPRRERPVRRAARCGGRGRSACDRRTACCGCGSPSAPGSTTHVALGSMTHRLAGRPAATGPPCSSAIPAMAAGCQDEQREHPLDRQTELAQRQGRARSRVRAFPGAPRRTARPSSRARAARGRWRWRRRRRRGAHRSPPRRPHRCAAAG